MIFIRTTYGFLLFSFVILLISCNKDEGIAVGPPSTVYFEFSDQQVNESDGLVSVTVLLDKPQNVKTVINFDVSGNAINNESSSINGDYELVSSSPLIIPAGEISGNIELRLIEDNNFESQNEHIGLTLNAILEGNARLSESTNLLSHKCDIRENDFKILLEWTSHDDSPADVEMFVELPNNQIVSSIDNQGVEELTIANTKTDERYFVDIWYKEGTSVIDYKLTFLKSGHTEQTILHEGHLDPFESSEVGSEESDVLKNYLLVKDGQDLVVL